MFPPLERVMIASLLWAWNRVRARFRTAQSFSLAFKVLNLLLLAPVAAWVLRVCLARWGRASIGNFEIAAFLLSPSGMTAVFVVGSLLIATLYFELAGLTQLLAAPALPWWRALGGSATRFHRLLELGLRQLGAYLLLATPFLLVIAAAYVRFWKGRDINGLLIVQPPVFWWGAGVAGGAVVGYLFLAGWWFIRSLLAVPILLFEPAVTVARAWRLSWERTHGRVRHFAAVLGAWAVLQTATAVCVSLVLRGAARGLLDRSDISLAAAIPFTATLLAVNVLAAAWLSVFANTMFSAVVLALYRESAGDAFLQEPPAALPASSSPGRRAAGVLAVLAVLMVGFSIQAVRNLPLPEALEITAHRAGAASAPENTVAAIKQAIVDGAEWAEIDVQRTADDALVVLHDTDLARVGGGDRQVGQTTLAEIRALDVGTSFNKKFSGEKIPTFDEVLAAAGTEIRLNVELKPHGKADAEPLTRRVVAAIQAAGMTNRCRICSQSYESLQLVRELEPKLPRGYIAALALGDLVGLDVEFLMVKSNRITRELVDRARLQNIQIHAWTVNDPAMVQPLWEAGVANIITDDPARMRIKLNEIQALDPAERLLLAARRSLY